MTIKELKALIETLPDDLVVYSKDQHRGNKPAVALVMRAGLLVFADIKLSEAEDPPSTSDGGE